MVRQALSVGRIAANNDMLTPEELHIVGCMVSPAPAKRLTEYFMSAADTQREARAKAKSLTKIAKSGHAQIADHFGISDETVFRIDEWQHCARDVGYFADHYVWVEQPQEGDAPVHVTQYHPTEAQKALLADLVAARSNKDAPHVIVRKKSRQVGYTTTTGIFALHAMMFHDSENIPLISCDEEASKEWLRQIMFSYEYLPDWLKKRIDRAPVTRVEFENHSRMRAWAATERAGRTQAATIVLIDEGALIENARKWDKLYQGACGSSSVAGVVCVGSTCNCSEDSGYAQWVESAHRNEEAGVAYGEMPWDSMPGRDQVWLAKQRLKYATYAQFATELLMSWEGSSYPCMPIEKLEELTNWLLANPKATEYNIDYADSFMPAYNPAGKSSIAGHHIVRMYKEPDPTHQYMLAYDASMGIGKDRQAIVLFDFTAMETALIVHASHTSIEWMVRVAYRLSDDYNGCTIILEQNGVNQRAVGYAMNVANGERLWKRQQRVTGFSGLGRLQARADQEKTLNDYGFHSHHDSKLEIMEFARNAFENSQIRIYDHALLGELKSLTVKQGGKVKADGTAYDDLSMAFMMVFFVGAREYHCSLDLTDAFQFGQPMESEALVGDVAMLGSFEPGNDEQWGDTSWLH